MKRRVAVVASHVIQYQAPFFQRLAAVPEIDLEVVFCSRDGAETYVDRDMQTSLRWDLDLLSGYRHSFLRNFGAGDGYARLVNPGIVSKIVSSRYDAIVFFLGWGSITALLGIAACRMSGTPLMLYGDSSFVGPQTPLRRAFLRAVVGSADAYLVSGAFNADFYRHYGADPRRFYSVPWAIDNDRYIEASRFAAGERDAFRLRLGISPDDFVVVYSGKLLPRKDPMTLLRAAAAMKHGARTAVLFLGHGELRGELESFARERGLKTHFPGFVNQSELPKHYAAADVFVLPSLDDPRATVVNEAMASGLPVIITDRCGPAGDIVKDGWNGYVIAAQDVTNLASRLDALAGDATLREAMAARSLEMIKTWNYDRGVEGVREALRATC